MTFWPLKTKFVGLVRFGTGLYKPTTWKAFPPSIPNSKWNFFQISCRPAVVFEKGGSLCQSAGDVEPRSGGVSENTGQRGDYGGSEMKYPRYPKVSNCIQRSSKVQREIWVMLCMIAMYMI